MEISGKKNLTELQEKKPNNLKIIKVEKRNQQIYIKKKVKYSS